MKLIWDAPGERRYESGVDHGVLYLRNSFGLYEEAVPWNGLTNVTESPTGAEANDTYADNIVYVSLRSAERFAGTIEALTWPVEFERCDGSAQPVPGLSIGQQNRETFGFVYRTKIGNDLLGMDAGYKLNIVYGATASPSEKAHETINDSPEPTGFSWEITTLPVEVPGFKPSATITIDSTKFTAEQMEAIEEILFGTESTDARLPLPAELIALLGGGSVTETGFVTAPTYNSSTHVITIPTTTGVVYKINNVTQTAGAKPAITQDTTVKAYPAAGYKFPVPSDDTWVFDAQST